MFDWLFPSKPEDSRQVQPSKSLASTALDTLSKPFTFVGDTVDKLSTGLVIAAVIGVAIASYNMTRR